MWYELWKEAFTNLKTHKLRNFLAMLGILWGAYAITMLMSLGEGFYLHNIQNLRPFIQPTLWVNFNQTALPYQGLSPNRILYLDINDIENLPSVFPSINAITPSVTALNIEYRTNNKQIQSWMQGVNPAYFNFFSSHYLGRTLNEEDSRLQRQVVFFNYYLKQDLFGDSNPIGQSITIDNYHFTVVGFATKPGNISFNLQGAMIPYSVFSNIISKQAGSFLLRLQPGSDIDDFQKQLNRYLAHKLSFSENDTGAVSYFNITKFAKTLRGVLLAAQIFLIFCGIMTLIVGAISIANMMYLLVKERTREIGLKMALGAMPKWILFGLLIETLVLVLSGGISALVLAIITLRILNQVSLPTWLGHPTLSQLDFAWIFGILIITAIIAGVFPARRAAMLNPVNAINARDD